LANHNYNLTGSKAAPSLRAMMRNPSCLISCSHSAPEGGVEVSRHCAIKPAGRAAVADAIEARHSVVVTGNGLAVDDAGSRAQAGQRLDDQSSIVAKARPGIRFNEHIEGDGPTVFAHACKMGLEGIVSKRKDSTYRSGRSPDWLKMKNSNAPAVKREAEEDWGKQKCR
jgi:hypothetical protein